MGMPRPGPETSSRFDALVGDFAGRGAKRSQMFGMPVLKVGNKVFAGTFGDAMTFKLGEEGAAKATRLKGVEAFEPMAGRSMKGWVLVPLEHGKRWPALAEQAWTFMSP